MKDFETRKKEYLDELKENEDYVENIISNNSSTEEKTKNLKRILDPNNEKELQIAQIVFMFFNDMKRLLNAFYDDNLKNIPLEENEGLKIFADYVEKYKNDPESTKDSFDLINPKEAAKIIFGYFVSFLQDQEGTIDFIMKLAGIEEDDDNIGEYMNGVQHGINMDKTKSIDEITDKELKQEKELINEFHKLCNQYIIEPEEKENQLKKML